MATLLCNMSEVHQLRYLCNALSEDVIVASNNWEGKRQMTSTCFWPGYKPHTTDEYAELTDKIRDEMAERDVVGLTINGDTWWCTNRSW